MESTHMQVIGSATSTPDPCDLPQVVGTQGDPSQGPPPRADSDVFHVHGRVNGRLGAHLEVGTASGLWGPELKSAHINELRTSSGDSCAAAVYTTAHQPVCQALLRQFNSGNLHPEKVGGHAPTP